MIRLLALDVSAQARATGITSHVALSAGVLAHFRDGDRATVEAYYAALVAVVLRAPRTPLGPGAYQVDTGSRRWVLLERERQEDGATAYAICAPIEVELAGTWEIELDVHERVERAEWLQ